MAYCGPDSGIGVFLRNHPKRSMAPGNLHVGIVGLGAGTLAAYGRSGDYFRYYEINPQVVGSRPLLSPRSLTFATRLRAWMSNKATRGSCWSVKQ